MASYTIKTTRKQQIGLQFSYDHAPNKTDFATIAEYFQYKINLQVTDPMYAEQQAAQAVSFDKSFNTVPELEQPATQTEIEGVIVAHGGTIIPAGASGPTPPGVPTGTIPTIGGTGSNNPQDGSGNKAPE